MERIPYTDSTEAVEGVFLAQLASTTHMNIQHFEIEPDATVPEHSHSQEQIGFVYAGELVFTVDGTEYVIAAGDSYAIPGNEAHAVENTSVETARGIDVFSPPRDNPAWQS